MEAGSIYSLQKQGKNEEALKAIASARAAGLDEATLQQAETNVRAAAAGGAAGGPAGATASEAYNKAFPIATQAYTDYNAKNYADSARRAEQAFRLDPSQGQWALLWIGALEAQEQLGAAIEAADAALALDPPNKSDLVAKRQTLRRSQAVLPAQKAYQALINPVFAECLQGIASQAALRGYAISPCTTEYDHAGEDAATTRLLASGVDGSPSWPRPTRPVRNTWNGCWPGAWRRCPRPSPWARP